MCTSKVNMVLVAKAVSCATPLLHHVVPFKDAVLVACYFTPLKSACLNPVKNNSTTIKLILIEIANSIDRFNDVFYSKVWWNSH